VYLKTPYAKCLHVWLIYDNCTHYVIHLHYIVSYLLISCFFLFSVCYYQIGDINLYILILQCSNAVGRQEGQPVCEKLVVGDDLTGALHVL